MEYSYVVRNAGNATIFLITVIDDQLGEISGSPINSLMPGEAETFTASTIINESVTNVVNVLGEGATGAFCADSDSVIVHVLPPPTCVIEGVKLKIGGKHIKWKLFNAGTETATIKRIEVSWPMKLGDLNKIKFGKTLSDTRYPPSFADITIFDGSLKDRQLKVGRSNKNKVRICAPCSYFAEGLHHRRVLRRGLLSDVRPDSERVHM